MYCGSKRENGQHGPAQKIVHGLNPGFKTSALKVQHSTTNRLFLPLCSSPRSLLPLLQSGPAGLHLHLRLSAGDQRPASGGDRGSVWKPAVLLRRLRFRRRAADRVHSSQRFKLPPVGQWRIWRGLTRVQGLVISLSLNVLSVVQEHAEGQGRSCFFVFH